MSGTCPKCGSEIEQDFGLVNCPGCGSVLAIDVDGQIQIAETSNEAPEGLQLDDESGLGSENNFAAPAEVEFQDLPDLSVPAGDSDDPFSLEVGGMEESEAPMDQAEAEENFVTNTPDGSLAARGATRANPVQGNSNLQEIIEFGNKDSSTGPLSYSVVIEGIDLAETRQRLLQIFSEPQFGWDGREILKRIKMGRLALQGLSPAQAVILVKLLRGTASNIDVSWSQHVYS